MKINTETKKKLLLQGIENKNFPNTVYKYRSIEQAKQILNNNSFWFAKPSTFNDPFDCSLSEEKNYAVDDVISFLNKTNKLQDEIDDVKFLLRRKPNEISKIAQKIKHETIDNKGILSLSKKNNDILMWSHYADNHKGIVIGLDMKKDLEFFLMPVKISYEDTYAPKNYFKEPEEHINQLIRTKSFQWSYEEELRIYKDESKLYQINPNAISNIYFGVGTTDNDIVEIRQLCVDKGLTHVDFYKAEKIFGKFAISFNKI